MVIRNQKKMTVRLSKLVTALTVKMKKNGYTEVTVIAPVDGLKKGDKVLVSATEFGQLEDESLVTCYKGDKKIITAKKNLQINV